DVSGVDLSPRMIENARRLHPECRFDVASATDLDLGEATLGGVLGWWSLFNLPREVLPQVLALFARALKPGGHLITATHVGDDDVLRTEAYGGVPVRWTTYRWRPERLVELIEAAGLRPVAELRLPADEHTGPGVVGRARRPGGEDPGSGPEGGGRPVTAGPSAHGHEGATTRNVMHTTGVSSSTVAPSPCQKRRWPARHS